jgi:hypothetical protein
MRVDEALQLCVEDLSLDMHPARAEVLWNGYTRTTKCARDEGVP